MQIRQPLIEHVVSVAPRRQRRLLHPLSRRGNHFDEIISNSIVLVKKLLKKQRKTKKCAMEVLERVMKTLRIVQKCKKALKKRKKQGRPFALCAVAPSGTEFATSIV
jgi:hypothetical protein